MIKQQYFQKAKAMMPRLSADRSTEFREGYIYALAWVLAGAEPCDKNRECPYGTGYAERDAWLWGWECAYDHAEKKGLFDGRA